MRLEKKMAKMDGVTEVRWKRRWGRETYEAAGVKRVKEREREKKTEVGVSSALSMIQTVVGGIGVYFPSIMHHLFAGGRGNMSSWAS